MSTPDLALAPKDFALMLRNVFDTREASWNGESYNVTLREACDAVCHPMWADIVHTLLYPGYADVWDWCDKVDPQ